MGVFSDAGVMIFITTIGHHQLYLRVQRVFPFPHLISHEKNHSKGGSMEESQDQAFIGAGPCSILNLLPYVQEQSRQERMCLCRLSLYLSGRHCRCVLGPARDPARSAQTGGRAVMQVSEEETRLGLTGPQDLHQFLPLGWCWAYEEVTSCLKELLIHPKFRVTE